MVQGNQYLGKVTQWFKALQLELEGFCFKTQQELSWNQGTNLVTANHVVVIISTAHLHSTKSGLWLCTGSNPAHGVLQTQNGKSIEECSWLKTRLKVFSAKHSVKAIHNHPLAKTLIYFGIWSPLIFVFYVFFCVISAHKEASQLICNGI